MVTAAERLQGFSYGQPCGFRRARGARHHSSKGPACTRHLSLCSLKTCHAAKRGGVFSRRSFKMKLAAILAALGITMLIYNMPHLWRDDGSSGSYGQGVFFGILFVFGAIWRVFAREDE